MQSISTPRQFFDEILEKDAAQFENNPSCLRTAFHACVAVLSLRDWIGRHYRGGTPTFNGKPLSSFKDGSQFGARLISIDNCFAVVFDVANSSKHMVLTRKGYTGIDGVSDISSRNVGSAIAGEAMVGDMIVGSDGVPTVEVWDGAICYDLSECIATSLTILRKLFAQNNWN